LEIYCVFSGCIEIIETKSGQSGCGQHIIRDINSLASSSTVVDGPGGGKISKVVCVQAIWKLEEAEEVPSRWLYITPVVPSPISLENISPLVKHQTDKTSP
jgi:hypothetical protein